MLNLKALSDQELLSQTKLRAAQEREAAIEVLWHLREVEARRLYAGLGFSSLWEYVVKELGYSEGAAQRRINSMRLLRDMPHVEKSLQAGQVTLSTLSRVQSFCRTEGINDPQEKEKLVESIHGKSQRETDRMLATLSPESATQERVRTLSEALTQITMTATKEQMAKFERAAQILSNKLDSAKWIAAFVAMADEIIAHADKRTRLRQVLRTPAPKESKVTNSPYVPRALKQKLLTKANHQCEFSHQGQRCTARHHLQIDHIHPRAMGGPTTEENLRVLCRTHNQWQALQTYGPEKMRRHWV